MEQFQDLPLNSDGTQMIWKDVWSAKSSKDAVVGIATQCSPDHLHHLLQTVEVWDGPVSVGMMGISLLPLTNILDSQSGVPM